MKKSFRFGTAFCSLLILALSACGGSTPQEDPSEETSKHTSTSEKTVVPIESDVDYPTNVTYLDEPGIQIHYQRTTGSYSPWGLWLWADGKDGAEYEFNYQDDYGITAYYPLSTFGSATKIGFIVKQLFSVAGEGNWKKEEYGDDRFIDIEALTKDEHDVYHCYILSGDENIYTIKDRSFVMNSIVSCGFMNNSKIRVVTNNKFSKTKLICNGDVLVNKEFKDPVELWTFNIPAENVGDFSKVYRVEVTFPDGVVMESDVSILKLYDSNFEEKYKTDEELGALYSKEQTEFRVWSPVSNRIVLKLYNSGTPESLDPVNGDDTIYNSLEMVKDEKGVFRASITGDLEGKYYTYTVYNSYNPNGQEIVDPYAKSTGVNGLRGMIVDFSKTNPEGWEDNTPLQIDRKKLTVYETHVADVTSSETWNGNTANAKKFLGLAQTGTSYSDGEKTVKTGFDHIKELGVNAVQLIPIFDQANDEINTSFNWGYNPLNYNTLEGSYSSNPYDGYQRIIEFKKVVQAYHEAGINIIMDVVYNHVNGVVKSNFDVLMPYYYFRYSDGAVLMNGSGCGNETASEKVMFRKFMIDSAKFWASEYKLGGFRFDLMGLHDITTMNELDAACKEINPNICIYGEPWCGGTSGLSESQQAIQKNASKYVGYGQFNDQMRDDLIKGGLHGIAEKGWVTEDSKASDTVKIIEGMKGITSGATSDPNKTVNYVTCHDNYTLHDRAIKAGITDEDKIEKMNVIANSIVFASQGTTFMLAGEEMLRSKPLFNKDGDIEDYSGNSYMSSYKTNELDYSLKIKHPEMFETYKKLIAMKQSASGLCLEQADVASGYEVKAENNGGVIVAKFSSGEDNYEVYIANGTANGYVVDTNGVNIYLDSFGDATVNANYELKPFETLILVK